MTELLKKRCIPCEGLGMKPFGIDQAEKYLVEVPGWNLDERGVKLYREYKFKDFVEAMKFVNKVAEIAESEGHHPDIQIHYNKVLIELWTHAIGGLSENDFILAAKVDAN